MILGFNVAKKIKMDPFLGFVIGAIMCYSAIYGVTLPRIKMFVISCIGAATSAIVVVLTNIMTYTYTGTGVIGLIGLINPEQPQIVPLIIASLVPFVFSFVLAYIYYKDDKIDEKDSEQEKIISQEVIFSPAKGDLAPLKECGDEAFASELLGKGILIRPTEGKIFAPFDGVVRTLFSTKHAIGIVSDNGCEVLIHIGYNTVRLEGKYFESFVNQCEGAYNIDGRGLARTDVTTAGTATSPRGTTYRLPNGQVGLAPQFAPLPKDAKGAILEGYYYPNHNAIDFYHHYKEDITLFAEMGFKMFRMSISWSRIFPNGIEDEPNKKGLEFYRNVFMELKKYNIEPLVTISHYDTPLYLEEELGGWKNRKLISLFDNYTEVLFK